MVIVDGRQGLVIVNPSDDTIRLYQKERTKISAYKQRFDVVRDLPAETTDKHRVSILANLELAEEIPVILKNGAEGVGLYRTEFFYMNRVDLPSEDEQLEGYRKIAEQMAPHPVTIRTLDLGGDKFISSVQIPKDMAPFMGSRAIRFCLERPDIFKTQLRAILRASVYGKLRLMYPMISGYGELKQANAILKEVMQSLRDEHIPFDEGIQVGLMIEVPSAAMIADLLAKEADFFSIGTNDLIQYTIAVDRVNEKTAHLYEPGHPAVLRLIQRTIDAGHNANIEVSLCGEMSAEPSLALILLGMGLDHFSMSAASMLQIKKLIRSVRYQDAQRVANGALTLKTGSEVQEYAMAQLKILAPDIYSMNEQPQSNQA
jgi:phosphotransferase system enzyme I (PtsI)